MKVTDIVSEKKINKAWRNSEFDNAKPIIDKYNLIAYELLKCVSGFHAGRTMRDILEELDLVTKVWTLTARGQRYLFAAYNNFN